MMLQELVNKLILGTPEHQGYDNSRFSTPIQDYDPHWHGVSLFLHDGNFVHLSFPAETGLPDDRQPD